MDTERLTDFLRTNVEPLKDEVYGNRYRAAVHLTDDTYLPCVVFQSRNAQVDLALRRFEEVRGRKSEYRMVVESFVAGDSRIAPHEIKTVEVSPLAWPVEVLKKIHGETAMGWTAFVVEMIDGTMHSYGTTFRFEFFELPKGYSFADITNIHSGVVYTEGRGLQAFSTERLKDVHIYRERPFFTCFLKML